MNPATENISASAPPALGTPEGATTNGQWTFAEMLDLGDLLIKVLGAVALLVSGWVAWDKYRDDQAAARTALLARQVQEDKIRVKEFQLRLFEQKMNHYVAICDAAARIAISDKLDDVRDDLRLFYVLYWGKICIFESKEVEFAQLAINTELAKATDLKSATSQELKRLCYGLAHACRKDLDNAFEQVPKQESATNRATAPAPNSNLFKWDPSRYLVPPKVTK